MGLPPTGRLLKHTAMFITKINKWWTTQMAVTVTLIKVNIALVMKAVEPSTEWSPVQCPLPQPSPLSPLPSQ